MYDVLVLECHQSVALNSKGQWCDWDDLTDEEREKWIAGQTAADEEWERRKNGGNSITLAAELLERENNQYLRHC